MLLSSETEHELTRFCAAAIQQGSGSSDTHTHTHTRQQRPGVQGTRKQQRDQPQKPHGNSKQIRAQNQTPKCYRRRSIGDLFVQDVKKQNPDGYQVPCYHNRRSCDPHLPRHEKTADPTATYHMQYLPSKGGPKSQAQRLPLGMQEPSAASEAHSADNQTQQGPPAKRHGTPGSAREINHDRQIEVWQCLAMSDAARKNKFNRAMS